MASASADNSVRLRGKLTRVGPLQYTPAGTALCELEMAVPQSPLGRASVGYVGVTVPGELAELARLLRVGLEIEVEGSLWARAYRDRQGRKVSEVRVVADRIERLAKAKESKAKESKAKESQERGERHGRDGRQEARQD